MVISFSVINYVVSLEVACEGHLLAFYRESPAFRNAGQSETIMSNSTSTKIHIPINPAKIFALFAHFSKYVLEVRFSFVYLQSKVKQI